MLPGTTRDGNNDDGGASGLLASGLAAVTGLGVALYDQQREEDRSQQQLQRSRSQSVSPVQGEKDVYLPPKSRSRPASPGPGADSDMRPRRLSMVRMGDSVTSISPTAVPIHFRKPPGSPNVQRRQSVVSPAQSPSSPRAGHRRPGSIEFKHAREYRPLWLVERHSSGKFDVEPEGPLPSLPSSKTTSRSTSVEDLREAIDDTFSSPSWHYGKDQASGPGSVSERSGERASVGLRISTDHANMAHADILDSQQPTPTAETYGQIGPPPVTKEKPKYEFHSPSELLQDLSAFHPELPSTLDPLPSVEGSLVGEKDVDIGQQEEAQAIAVSKDDVKPSTPPAEHRGEESKSSSSAFSSFLTGAGLASVVDAAVAAAVDHRPEIEKNEMGEAKEAGVLPQKAERAESASITEETHAPALEHDKEAQHEVVPSVEETSKPRGVSPFALAGAGAFGGIVDAAVAAAVGKTDGDHKQYPGLDSDESKGLMEDDHEPAYGRPHFDAGEPSAKEPPEEMQRPPPSNQHGEDGFMDIVEAAVTAADNAETRDPGLPREESTTEVSPESEEVTTQPAEEATVDDFAPVTSTSKKKKKKDKKAAKKAHSIDLTTGSFECNEQSMAIAAEAEAVAVEPGAPEATERAEPFLQAADEENEIAVAAAPVVATVDEEAPVLASASDQKPADITPEQSSAVENAGDQETPIGVERGTVDGQDVERIDVEAVRAVEAETGSRPTVEQPQPNDGTPHMPAEPEDESWSTTETKTKKKKDKKKRQSLLSTGSTNEEPQKSEESTVEWIHQPTAEEAKVSESLLPVDSANKELPKTAEDKKEEDNFTMTLAQKKKAKKDKKKRQSLPWDEEPTSDSAETSIKATPHPADETEVADTAAQDEVPTQEEQVASDTQEQLAVSELQTIEVTAKEEADDFQSAKSKKKGKKEKKKRQSLGWDEDPEPPKEEPAEGTPQPIDEVPTQGEQLASDMQEQLALSESQPIEEADKEEVQEFQSAKSKKKAKKEKTKQQSLGWDEDPEPPKEEPAEGTPQPIEAAGVDEATAGQDDVPVQAEPLAETNDYETVSAARPIEETIKEVVQEFQSAKSKKKAKKDKKKRQSLSWDEESAAEAAPEPPESTTALSTEAPVLAEDLPTTEGAVAHKEVMDTDTQEQPANELLASENLPKEEFHSAESKKAEEDVTGQPSTWDGETPAGAAVEASQETPSAEADTTPTLANEPDSEEGAVSVEPTIHEPEPSERPAKDELEDFLSAKSRKKAKKDKKKRQSLSWDEGVSAEATEQSTEASAIEDETLQSVPPVKETAVSTKLDEQAARDEFAAPEAVAEFPISPPEETVETPTGDVEEFQSAKSKKKSKKDKKKRQSLSWDDKVPAEATQQSTEASAIETEITQEISPIGETTISTREDEQAPREESAAPEMGEKEIDVAMPAEVLISQPEETVETPTGEVEEFQSAKSKKKAKKDKKKRQSFVWDEEPAPERTDDVATTSAIDTTPHDQTTSAGQEDERGEPVVQQLSSKSEALEVSEEVKTPTEGQAPAAEVESTEELPAQDEEMAEQPQTAKFQRKAKKEKKKRQSLAWDEEPTPESPKDSGEGLAETAAIPPAMEEAFTAKDMDFSGSSREESTAPDALYIEDIPNEHSSELQPTETGAQEPQAEEQDWELPSAKSKKKAKKDKKKRQSLPWDEEPTVTSQKTEDLTEFTGPTEPAIETVDTLEATSAVEPSPSPLEEIQQSEPSPQELPAETPPTQIPAEDEPSEGIEQPEPPSGEPAAEIPVAEKPAEDEDFQFQSAKSKKKAKKEKKKRQTLQWDEAPTQEEESIAPVIDQTQDPASTTEANMEAIEREVTTDKGAGDLESTAEIASTRSVEPPQSEISTITSDLGPDIPGENESDPVIPAEPEEEFLSVKAKKKAKKEKKKRQSLDWTEEEPAATTDAVQETQGEKEKEAAAEDVEGQKEDTGPLPEKTSADDSEPFISTKDKRKAKKDKKRRSVTWVDEIAEAPPQKGEEVAAIEPTPTLATADLAEDIATQAQSSEKGELEEPEFPEPQTALQETPVEADGKETFQPSDKIGVDQREKDIDWTDDMVSSQVEPQTEESPYPVPSPTLAKPSELEPETSSLPVPSVVDQGAREIAPSDVTAETRSFAAEESTEIAQDVSPSDAAAPEQAEEGDFWAVPSKKKNKKEKKKKRDSTVPSAAELSNQEEQAAPSAATEESQSLEKRDIPVEEEKAAESVTPPQLEFIEATKEILSTSDTGGPVMTTEDDAHELVNRAQDATPGGQEAYVSMSAESTADVDVQRFGEEEGFASAPSEKKSKKKKKRQSLGQIADYEQVLQVEESSDTGLTSVETAGIVGRPRSVDQLAPVDDSEPAPVAAAPESTPPEYSSQGLTGEGAGEAEDFWAVSTKKGKKDKKKKGRRDVQEAEIAKMSALVTAEGDGGLSIDEPTPVTAEEITSGPANEPLAPAPGTEPAAASVSLDPFDIPESADDQQSEASAGVNIESVALAEKLSPLQAQEESQERLRRRALEQEDDLAVAEDLFGEQPRQIVEGELVARKLSKKKKKATQKALALDLEETSQPESKAMPKVTERIDTQAAHEPVGAVAPEPAAQETSQNDDILLRRSSTKKKKGKKKRMDSLVSEPNEISFDAHVPDTAAPAEATHSVPEEHQLTMDERETTTETLPVSKGNDSWPSIDWDKDRNVTASDIQQYTPEPEGEDTGGRHPSLEREPETAIGEFEDNAAVQPEEPFEAVWSASMSKGGKRKSKKRAKEEEKKEKEVEPEVVIQPVEVQQSSYVQEPALKASEEDRAFTEERGMSPALQPLNDQSQSEQKGNGTNQALEMGLAVAAAVGLLDSPATAKPTMEQSTPKGDGAKLESPPEESWLVSSKKGRGRTGKKSTYEQDRAGDKSSQQSESMAAQQPSTSRIANIFPGLERANFRRTSPKPIPSEPEKKSPVLGSVTPSQQNPDENGLNISVEVDPSFDVSVLSDDGTGTQEHAVEIHWQDESEKPAQDKRSTMPLTDQRPIRDSASSVEATSKDRSSSILFDSSPSTRIDPTPDSHRHSSTSPTRFAPPSTGGLHRSSSIHGHHTGPRHSWALDDDTPSKRAAPRPPLGDHADISPPRTPLDPIREHDGPLITPSPRLALGHESVILPRPGSRNSTGSARSLRRANRNLSGDFRAAAANYPEEEEDEDDHSLHQKRKRDLDGSGDVDQPPQKQVETEAEAEAAPSATESQPQQILKNPDLSLIERIPSSSTYDPITDKGKRPVRSMTDVYVS
jgi:hypothetical protein